MRLFLPLIWLGLIVSAYGSITPYAGAIGGIATLSADAGVKTNPQGLSLSSYSPSNGGALNVFAGAHLTNHFSLQLNYIWNRNHLVLNSGSSGSTAFYQQARSSSQYAGVLDFLVYFRRPSSWVRPYSWDWSRDHPLDKRGTTPTRIRWNTEPASIIFLLNAARLQIACRN